MRAEDRPLVNDFVSDEEFDQLLRAWFGQIARVLEPGRAFYIWGGYSVSYQNRHASVRVSRERYNGVNAYLVDLALRRTGEHMAGELGIVDSEPDGPIRRQLLNLLRAVNRARKQAGLETVPMSSLRVKRRIYRPFEGGSESDVTWQTPSIQEANDLLGKCISVVQLAFPNHQDFPTEFLQTTAGRCVARLVAIEFLPPEPGARVWEGTTLPAVVAMPKATVDQDDLPSGPKDEVGFSRQSRHMESVPIPERMCQTPKCQLRFSVLAANRLHDCGSFSRREHIGHSEF